MFPRSAFQKRDSLFKCRHRIASTIPSSARHGQTRRFRATLAVVFGGAALVLGAVGIYGLAARRVAERRREIGVRIALGAGPGQVRRLVLRETAIAVTVGLALGLPAAFGAAGLIRAFLFEVTPTTGEPFLLSAAVLACSALVATLVPAVRATRIDPVSVLRE